MSKLTTEQLAKGRKRFLDGHLEAKFKIDSLTQRDADALGVSLELLRETETMRELSEVARVKGIDSTELFWSCIADTAEELGAMLERRDALLKRAMGL
ncbi:DUF6388 family protein [Burkholderia stagnalis]|uniref:DUF6388 family protein n=1 Tax=Burkholderia stagnalis TaxID=1503054 RepID=UPI000758B119|nr:DUF6388 family protein [Burkholderia stagnalis]KVL93084.1 hypothetical protein WT03_18945 [Burkholderia stagnalis]KVL94781.1 hypothetical protein WT02_18115 [Burkholderia stagnalis]KVM13114.1 hypothetical protein WT04_11435 [Burkholderia stagnalis]